MAFVLGGQVCLSRQLHLLGYDGTCWSCAAACIAPNSLYENLLGSHHLYKRIVRFILACLLIFVVSGLASRCDVVDLLAELRSAV